MTRGIRPGDRVNRLIVLEAIGQGARGVVYKAYDPRLARHVALKLLRELHDDRTRETARRRLVKEAQAMAQLAHPNVVAIHDVGTVEVDGRVQVYLAMELVEGESLAARMPKWRGDPRWRRGRLWREIVEVFAEAGEGLAAAHAQRLVHRDFKPANVLVDDDGRVRVTDFGLVRRVDEAARAPEDRGDASVVPGDALDVPLTQTGALVGTPAYMAPEQFAPGQFANEDGDARVDQFAFCVALFEALYGARPFPGELPAQIAKAIFEGRPPRPPADAPSVPRHVQRAVARGLRRDPEDRFTDMDELLAALARDPRRAVLRVAAALALVAALVGAGLGVWMWTRPGTLEVVVRGPGESGQVADDSQIEVWIDGRPATVERGVARAEVDAGLHQVRVRARDYELAERAITVARGGAATLDVELEHEQGFVHVGVAPAGPVVSVDGRGLDFTLDTGPRELRVSRSGAHEALLRFDLERGERLDLPAYLRPAVVFEAIGGGLELGRGVLGDVDGDGNPEVWELDYATLSVHSPARASTLWRRSVATDDHAMFVRVEDLDGDGVGDPLVLARGESGAALAVWHGADGSVRWSDDVEARAARPRVPPVIVEVGGRPVVVAASLEPGAIVAYDGASGERRWRAAIAGPVFGLASAGSWIGVAHLGGVTALDGETGALRWSHAIDSFDERRIAGLEADHDLENFGREGARSWLLAGRYDAAPGLDLLLTAVEDDGEGPLLALTGDTGEVLWRGPRVDWRTPTAVGDLDGDERDDLRVGGELLSGVDGARIGALEDEEVLGRWPCEGPVAVFRIEDGSLLVRRLSGGDSERLTGLDDVFFQTRCTDWNGDGSPDLVLSTGHNGVRALGPGGREIGSIALDRRVDFVVPLGDVSEDARPDFFLTAEGPAVALGSRALWARQLGAPLRAEPVVADLDGDGARELAVFNGQHATSHLEIFAAETGRRIAAFPQHGFDLRAPALVDHGDSADLVFVSNMLAPVRVRGRDRAAQTLATRWVDSYAGVAVDGGRLWAISDDIGPHLRALRATEADWLGGPKPQWPTKKRDTGGRTSITVTRAAGSSVRPQIGQLDSDPSEEVVAVLDRAELIVVDAQSGAVTWSRPTASVDPLMLDLDGDGDLELVISTPSEAGLDWVALDGEDGSVRWTIAAGGSSVAGAVVAGLEGERWIVAPGPDRMLQSFDCDGAPRWTTALPEPVAVGLAVGDLDGDGRQELAVGLETGAVAILDAQTGERHWIWTPPESSPPRARPVLADVHGDGRDELLVASGTGVLFVLDGMFARRSSE